MKFTTAPAQSQRNDSVSTTPTTPRVTGIYTAAAAGAPMVAHESVELIAGAGIRGDRYAAGLGFWSDPRWPDQELTLVESEIREMLKLAPGALRRNIETRGVNLDQLIGVEFALAEALLLGVRDCEPCRHLEELTRPGVLKQLALGGGLRARILRGGRIQTGDPIVIRGAANQEE
jgi:hypothetical protein